MRIFGTPAGCAARSCAFDQGENMPITDDEARTLLALLEELADQQVRAYGHRMTPAEAIACCFEGEPDQIAVDTRLRAALPYGSGAAETGARLCCVVQVERSNARQGMLPIFVRAQITRPFRQV